MSKTYLLILLLSLISLSTRAQKEDFHRHIYSLGLNTYGPYGSDMGAEAFYDVRVNEWLSLGGLGELDVNPKVIHEHIDLFLGGRINIHFFNHLKEEASHWDPYIGFTGGMKIDYLAEDYMGHYDCYIGGRYFIKKHWAVFAEIGSSDSIGFCFAL